MSSEHKRPLYAFAVVALVCALSVGNGLRSDAVVGLLRAIESPRMVVPDRPATSSDADVVDPDRVVGLSSVTTPASHAPARAAVSQAKKATTRTHPRGSGRAGPRHGDGHGHGTRDDKHRQDKHRQDKHRQGKHSHSKHGHGKGHGQARSDEGKRRDRSAHGKGRQGRGHGTTHPGHGKGDGHRKGGHGRRR